jgi:UDP-N-acetylmuramate dehydrogenase
MNEEEILAILVKDIAHVDRTVSLGPLNPLGVGGTSDFYTEATTTIELAAAVKAAIDAKLPYAVVGEANNVLFSDGGFPGLVIHNKARHVAFDRMRSQVVVDSGVRLRECVTQAAALGLGGMTQFYGEAGTVGGAAYMNLEADGFRFLSLVRSLTMLMPPTKYKAEATIGRYAGEWLKKDGERTKLHIAKAEQPLADPQPIILTQVLQLTSMRPEEIRQEVMTQARRSEQSHVAGAFGPLFQEIPGLDMQQVLASAGAAGLRVGGMFAHRYHLNYIGSRGRHGRAADIRELSETMCQRVHTVHGITLEPRFELLGVW